MSRTTPPRSVAAPISIPTNADPQMRSTLQAIKESLEVTIGQRGHPLDRAPSMRELLGTGLFTNTGGVLRSSGSFGTDGTGTGVSGGGGSNWSGPLPAPEAVYVTGTATAVLVYWDAVEAAGSAISYTEVWAQGPSEFGGTIPAADVSSAMLMAISGFTRATIVSQSNREWRFFVRHVGFDGELGPWHDVAGVEFKTPRLGMDVYGEVEAYLSENFAAGEHLPTLQYMADSYALWAPGANYGTVADGKDPEDRYLVLGYANIDGDNLLTMQNVYITNATIDTAIINGMLTAGELNVIGAINGETVTALTIDGGEIGVGVGPFSGYQTFISGNGNISTHGNLYVSGNATFTGNTNIGGTVTIGSTAAGNLRMTNQRLEMRDSNGAVRVRFGLY